MASTILGGPAPRPAMRILVNLATNDFMDLLSDVEVGSGRAAMRASRALIEHAVNLATLEQHPEYDEQYMEHLDQGPALLFHLEPGVNEMDRKQKENYRRVIRKFGKSANRRFERSVQARGPWFRRGWTQQNLNDRATTAGLAHLYEYYRMGSLVAHGSAGGSVGIVRERGGGNFTFRTGPALELAPIALWSGLLAYEAFLDRLAHMRPDAGIGNSAQVIELLKKAWPHIQVGFAKLDAQTWPKNPIPYPSAVLVFGKNKRRRWYLHVPLERTLIEAEPPVMDAETEKQISRIIEHFTSVDRSHFRADQRMISTRVLGMTVTPIIGGRVIPETSFFTTYSQTDVPVRINLDDDSG